LRGMMWRRVGLVRDAEGLREVIDEIESLRHRRAALPESGRSDPSSLEAVLDLDSMLITAEATARAALLRTESRGAHQRREHPETDSDWQRTVVVSLGPDGLALSTAELPAPSPDVVSALPEGEEIDIAGRLLE
jgi:succinate dehydrogenase / fumarate reductase, flavoprotein subunit